MLNGNIDVAHGLFNGSVETVVGILYFNGRRPSDSLPNVVMVQFGNNTGPPFVQYMYNPQLFPLFQ